MQQMQQVQQQMQQQMQQVQQQTQQQMQQMQQQIQQVQQQMQQQSQQMQQQMQQQFANLSNEIYNSNIRAYNNSAISGESLLRPLRDGQGNLIAPFPATRGDIERLTRVKIDALIIALGLQGVAQGNLNIKRRAIADEVGIRL